MELVNKSSDVVLPSIEQQDIVQEVKDQEIAPLVQQINKDREEREKEKKKRREEDKREYKPKSDNR